MNNIINKNKIENNILNILKKISENNKNINNYDSLKINIIHNLYKISKKYNLEELIKIFEIKYKKIIDKKILYWRGDIINNNKLKQNILDILKKNKINIKKYNIKDEFHITLFFPEKKWDEKYDLLSKYLNKKFIVKIINIVINNDYIVCKVDFDKSIPFFINPPIKHITIGLRKQKIEEKKLLARYSPNAFKNGRIISIEKVLEFESIISVKYN
jgi:hypothetical protein